MSVTVNPASFAIVLFDADEIRRIATHLVDVLGIEGVLGVGAVGAVDVTVDVDETSPLARISTTIGSETPVEVRIRVDSGAFEDTRRPRQLSVVATSVSLGRALLRAKDRMSAGFDEAPADEDLELAHVAAWETFCIGRLDRAGIAVHRQRWLYNFRNRHGFSDAVDATFDRLWNTHTLVWSELRTISDSARVVRIAS